MRGCNGSRGFETEVYGDKVVMLCWSGCVEGDEDIVRGCIDVGEK